MADRKRIALAMILAAAALAAGAQQLAPTGKFGFVNTERILREAAPAMLAQKRIDAEFRKRDQEISRMAAQLKQLQADLAKNAATMSEQQRLAKEREFAELNRDFQRNQRVFREDLDKRRAEEMATVVAQGNRIIREIAEREGYDIIFQDSVFVSPRVDITDRVIKTLDRK